MQTTNSESKMEFQRRVYKFALDVIALVEELPKGQVSRTLGDQLLRSATSIGANVAEAKGAGSKKDYTNYFTYALKSANETKFWLSLLLDSGKADKKPVDKLLKEVAELANILASSIITLKEKR
jgi:four helix bundle protein